MEGWKPPFLPAPEGGGFRAVATVIIAVFYWIAQKSLQRLPVETRETRMLEDRVKALIFFLSNLG